MLKKYKKGNTHTSTTEAITCVATSTYTLESSFSIETIS